MSKTSFGPNFPDEFTFIMKKSNWVFGLAKDSEKGQKQKEGTHVSAEALQIKQFHSTFITMMRICVERNRLEKPSRWYKSRRKYEICWHSQAITLAFPIPLDNSISKENMRQTTLLCGSGTFLCFYDTLQDLLKNWDGFFDVPKK